MIKYSAARKLFFTVDEVAKRFGVSTSTVRNRIKEKKIPAKKIGNAYLINRTEMENIEI